MNCSVCLKHDILQNNVHDDCKKKLIAKHWKKIYIYYLNDELRKFCVLKIQPINKTIQHLLKIDKKLQIVVHPLSINFFSPISNSANFCDFKESNFLVHLIDYVPTFIENIVRHKFRCVYAVVTYEDDTGNLQTVGKWALETEHINNIFGDIFDGNIYLILSQIPLDHALNSGIVDPNFQDDLSIQNTMRRNFIAYKPNQDWFFKNMSRGIFIRYGNLNKEVKRFVKAGDNINITLKNYGSKLLKRDANEILVSGLDEKGIIAEQFSDSQCFIELENQTNFSVYTRNSWEIWNNNAELIKVFFMQNFPEEKILVNKYDNVFDTLKSVDVLHLLFGDNFDQYRIYCSNQIINHDATFADINENILYITKSNNSLMKITDIVWPKNLDQLEANQKMIVIGTINGDYRKARLLLRDSNVISPEDDFNWIAGNSVLVQTGNLIGPKKESLKVLELFYTLQEKANDCNGKVILLMGENELFVLYRNWLMIDPEDDLYVYAKSHSPTNILKTIQNQNNILTNYTFLMCYKLLAMWKCGQTILSHGQAINYTLTNKHTELYRINKSLHKEITQYNKSYVYGEITTYNLNREIKKLTDIRTCLSSEDNYKFLKFFDANRLVFSITEEVDYDDLEENDAEIIDDTGNLICLFNGNKIYIENGNSNVACFLYTKKTEYIQCPHTITIENNDVEDSNDEYADDSDDDEQNIDIENSSSNSCGLVSLYY